MDRLSFLSGLTASSPSQLRSATPSPKTIAKPKSDSMANMANTLMKAKSASQLSNFAMLGSPARGRAHLDSDSTYLNTLPDPRTPSPATRTNSTDSHPDLSNEVAMLSTKLINAINHQTSLDDTLQQTRHELETAKRRIVDLVTKSNDYATQISRGTLVKRSEMDKELKAMREELSEAQKQRVIAENGKKEMEVELENLTSALFEEANTMVAAARKESEATERKNAQLRSQLNDTELLLASQQEQLADLKGVMERMSSERDETETIPHSSTAPSTPGHDTANKTFEPFPMSPSAPAFNETPPDQPLRFSHLITPIMRTDVQAYADFADLLKSSRAANPSHSRNSSTTHFSNSQASNSSVSMVSSSPSIPGSFTSAVASSPRESSYTSSLPPLKDNKFYKRCLVEDIEPALRLDLAPGLSWLARRTVISAIASGTFVIEPFIPQSRFYGNVYACSLCGESRRTEAHARRHRFRTSEDDSAQRHPLCGFCLGRVRATCDFLGFLRMVRDGLWRAKTEDDINDAWDESVRLREKMFWARLGGGVVPALSARLESPSVIQRRPPGSLLRRTSSDFSNITRLSRDDVGTSSLDSQVKTSSLSRIHNPLKITTIDANAPAIKDSDVSDLQDFAAAKIIQSEPEAPVTPTIDVGKQSQRDLHSPSTPKSQTNTVESSSLPEHGEKQQEENTQPQQDRRTTEENAPEENAIRESIAEENTDEESAAEKSASIDSITETNITEKNNVQEIAAQVHTVQEEPEPASSIPGSFD